MSPTGAVVSEPFYGSVRMERRTYHAYLILNRGRKGALSVISSHRRLFSITYLCSGAERNLKILGKHNQIPIRGTAKTIQNSFPSPLE